MEQRELKIRLVGDGFMKKTHAYAVSALSFFFENLSFRAKITGAVPEASKRHTTLPLPGPHCARICLGWG